MKSAHLITFLGSVLAVAAASQLSCGSKPQKSHPIGPAPDGLVAATDNGEPDDGLLIGQDEAPDGLNILISEGSGRIRRTLGSKPAAAKKLSAADSSALLARMPALTGAAGDKKAFALRGRSQPPPRTGKTVSDTFPGKAGGPPAAATGNSTKPVKVVRHAPVGELPVAPHLSVTFNQPMIAVTSHTDTTASGVPVKLSPQPKGQWRWVGTRTLLFDPTVRFPAATEYTVTVPKGTRSASGQLTAEPMSFKFGTPAPRVVSQHPTGGPQKLDPLMFVMFDQKIDPSAVLAKIKLSAAGRSFRVRKATEDEIKEDKTVLALVESAEKREQNGRYVVFRVGEDLPKEKTVTVSIEKGTPSAEGPRTTKANQGFSFQTYGPLRIRRSRCSWGRNCPPGTPWTVEFNNPLDPDAFETNSVSELILTSPELLGKRPRVSSNYLTIEGASKGRTRYTVTIPAAITDTFGQTLGKDATVYFNVGKAEPNFYGPRGLVIIDPISTKPTLNVFSTNVASLDVSIYRVKPSDWAKFALHMRNNPRDRKAPPGARVRRMKVRPKKDIDALVETPIDVSTALNKSGLGHAVVIVEPTTWPNRYKPSLRTWVQSTQIGLDAFVDGSELVAWATSLKTGKPIPGVNLEIAPYNIKAVSAANGLSRIPLAKTANSKQTNMLIATKGPDLAFLPENVSPWSSYGGWSKQELGTRLSWFVFDDRKMYRPGETVNIKGWIRALDFGEGGDVGLIKGNRGSVGYVVKGPRGNEIAKGTSSVSRMGGFDFKIKLPKTPNLGFARVELTSKGTTVGIGQKHSYNFSIQEFRRPEYEVTTTATPGPYMVGKGTDVTVNAQYFAGGGLANAEVRWNVSSQPGQFTPPNRGEFTFGRWIPWWRHHSPNYKLQKRQNFQGKTDASGKHVVRLDFLSSKPPRPMNVTAEAYVTDVNRQQWAASTNMLVHPSDLYVGLKRDRYFVERGKPIKVSSVVVDHDGKAVLNRVLSVKAVRLEWKYKDGTWKETESGEQTCDQTSSAAAQECSFATQLGGTYRVVARVVDDRNRPNETEVLVWVSGGKSPPKRNVELEKLTLVPNQKDYKAGDTAEILVQSPFFPAEGLMTTRRSGIVDTIRFTMTGPTTKLKIPIVEGHVPNIHVQFDVVGAAERLDDKGEPAPKLPKRPAFASGTINLSVPPVNRTLTVEVNPAQKKLEPGGKTSVNVTVKDHLGRGVAGAELAAIVVDESVLALSAYKTPDPVAAFYAARAPGARDYRARQYVKLAKPELSQLQGNIAHGTGTALRTRAPMGGAEADNDADGVMDMANEEAPIAEPSDKREEKSAGAKSKRKPQAQPNNPIAVRKNFDALAKFAPIVTTDSSGRATVAVTLPDSLTRYRVMVIATARENQFGSGESNITARMPLMVRPSPPRFLNFGDKFELPVVLQNQTDEAMTVRVAIKSVNAAITDGNGRSLTIPANDRVEVRFPAAAELPGIARFQVGAEAGRWADATELAMPVWTPATTEAFATYGEIDKGAIRQPVSMPKGVVKEFGGLEVSTSSTQLQALTDAFVYLVSYPYECSEQTASRVIAISALRDVLGAFEAEGLPDANEIERIIERDIKHLRSMQNHDGGFAFWVRGRESWPYNSIHAANAMVRAQQKGYKIPAEMLSRSKRYLRQIERHIPWYYPLSVRRTLISYALYVRKRMGDRDTPRALKLIRTAGLKNLSMEAIGWLLGSVTGDATARTQIGEIHRHLDNKATETAATAHWTTSYSDGAHLILHSSRRADGIILESLIDDKPKSDMIPKVVRGLLAHRKRGRWGNTQENAFVLLAMDRYFREFEKVTPNFVAKVWLGDQMAPTQSFRGRQTKRHHLGIPMSYVANAAKSGTTGLTISKEGPGRLYYRIGMNYAPADLKLGPADHGFAIDRVYEPIDDPNDVTRLKDGTWKIKAGAQVRVRLTMVAEARRYHVALVDPLPAGLEPMNPALAVTGSIPQDPNANKGKAYWWWYRTWYEHQNMRDERVEAFTSLLWAGAHEYTYVARATTPGNFVVPPTKAEEMYFPETFGRSGSARVVIE